MNNITTLINSGQLLSLNKLLGEFFVSDIARRWAISHLLARDIDDLRQLTLADWQYIRDAAFPNWPENDWAIGDDFRRRMGLLIEQYREEVCGQLRLFGEDAQ